MQYRTLGRTGFKVSEIGFGAWAIGGMWGQPNDQISLKALRHAIALGINFIDTAAIYGMGRSEQLVGTIYREQKGRFTIATKIPPKNWKWPAQKQTPIKEAFPSDWIRKNTENSLRNLRVDCVDIQQLHVWSANWVHESDWFETLSKLKEEGKIKFIGVSLNDREPNEALELVKSKMVDTVQVIYNVFEQSPEDKLFPLCKENNIGVIARSPLDEGSLTGKFDRGTKFPDDDWRKNYFSPKVLNETIERVEKLHFLVKNGVPSLTVGALKYCLSHPLVSTVIPGIRTVAQAQENCSSSDGHILQEEELKLLKHHRWNRS